MSDISLCKPEDRKCGDLQATCRRAFDKPGEMQSYVKPDCYRGAECNVYYHIPSADEVLTEWYEETQERRREAFS